MLKLSWSDIETLSVSISDALARQSGPFDAEAVIVGVARGGLIPAALIAHRLGVRRVMSLGLMSYADGVDAAQGALTSYGPEPAPETVAVVVDDIIDSGRTLDAVRARFPNALHTALVDKTEGRAGVIAGRQAAPADWVEFPWEAFGERGE